MTDGPPSPTPTPSNTPHGRDDTEAWLERIRALETSVLELRRELALVRSQLDLSRAADGEARLASLAAPSERSSPHAEPVHVITPSDVIAPSRDEALRSAFRAELAGSATAEPPRSVRSELRRASMSASQLESLVGRYGMLALSTLAVLAGVGTFLKWAIAKGWLSPPVRVVIGLVVAAALASVGLRLRRRERSFGSTLLGLALAIAHVCAWASGPSLHLVPDAVAFTGVALVSMVLAVFAFQEADEPLWCVGFGGAAIAPFVTSSGGGQATLLALYGALVLLSGCWALRDRSWTIAERVLQGVTAIFVIALASMPERQGGPLLAVALPLVVAVGGALPSAARERVRARLRALGLFGALAAARAAAESQPVIGRHGLAILLAASGVVWLALVDLTAAAPATLRSSARPRDTDSFFDWLDACWIPLVIAAAAVVGLDDGRWGSTWTLAGASLAFVFFVARRPPGFLRDAGAFAAGAAAIASVIAAGSDSLLVLNAIVAVLAVVLLALHRWRPSKSWLALAALSLIAASAAALGQLSDRTPYAYTPFGTNETAMALVVALSWVAAAQSSRRLIEVLPPSPRDDAAGGSAPRARQARRFVTGARALAGAFAFLWVNVELAHAVSPTVALLLLITYYAVTAVASVGLGRMLSAPELRRIGLALALLAALVAFDGARGIDSVAARIAAYLVTAVFLLGIAYWYRRPGPLPERPAELSPAAAAPVEEKLSGTL